MYRSSGIDTLWMMLGVLAVLFGAAAIILSLYRPGKNVQAIRAIAVTGMVFMGFWLGVVALTWAVVDGFFPNLHTKLPELKKKLDKQVLAEEQK